MRFNPNQDQTQLNDTVRCPTCGMYVNRLITKCPQDGTILAEGLKGAFAERYEFLESLGTGGMSIIYKARHRVLNRIVAIKMMHEHMMNEQAIRRFQQEGQSASSLDHPNIVKVHDFGLTDRGQPYMVMDLVEGRSLSQVLDELGELPITQCLMIFIDICDALIHAHGKSILHRDLKPSNIMLTTTFERPTFAKLVDFGIAKIMEEEGGSSAMKLTQTGELFGSPPYMSPEQCYGKKLDRRSDIYSLGCLMFECLTGRTPFQGDTFVEILSKQMTAKAPLLHEVRPDKKYPSHLEDVIDKCLTKQPEGRFRSIEDIKAQLVSIQREVDDGLQKEHGSMRQFRRSLFQWKYVILLLCGLAVLCSVGWGMSHFRSGHVSRRRNFAYQKAKFIPLMRPNAITTPIIQECLFEDAGIKSLDLHDTNIDDGAMQSINKQLGIRVLDLRNTAVTSKGLLLLKDLHELEELDLEGTQITTDGLVVLQSMPELKKLSVRNTKVDRKGIGYLAQLKKLEDLNISKTSIEGPCLSPLGRLQNLQNLNLSATSLEAADLASMRGLPVLRQLAISDCAMANSAIQHLITLPALSNLEMHATEFGDDCVQYLAKLHHLKTLDISTTRFTQEGLERLSKSVDLYEIHMRDYEIDQKTIAILKNFHDLHVLDIQDCSGVNDELVKSIATIKTINSLDIAPGKKTKNHNDLTPRAIDLIAIEMPQMVDLDLRRTDTLDRQSLASLAKMGNLRALHLQSVPLNKVGGRDGLALLKHLLLNCRIEH